MCYGFGFSVVTEILTAIGIGTDRAPVATKALDHHRNRSITSSNVGAYTELRNFTTYEGWAHSVNSKCKARTFRQSSMVLFVSVEYDNTGYTRGSFSFAADSQVEARIRVAAYPLPQTVGASTEAGTKAHGAKVIFLHTGSARC